MNRAVYVVLFLFIAFYSYADIGINRSVCSGINYQSTDCQKLKNIPTIDEMKEELDYLKTQYQLDKARKGIFDAPIIIIQQQPQQRQDDGVIVKAYFEEE